MNHILRIVPKDSSILELGSGYGSHILSQHANMICVEHDNEWIGMFDDIEYIHSPLIDVSDNLRWYDPDILRKELSGIKYDFLLVDGPPSQDRIGFFKYTDIFLNNIPWCFDDTNRRNIFTKVIDFALDNNKKISMPKPDHMLDLSKSSNPLRDVSMILKKEFSKKKKSHLILI